MSNEVNPSLHSPLVLAYIGDAVYEVFTREKLLGINPNLPAHKLHKENVRYVRAKAQSNAMEAIEPILAEDELAIYKRGRNAHNNNTPKSSSEAEYHSATGVEVLFGYLYLNGETDRARELFEIMWESGIE